MDGLLHEFDYLYDQWEGHMKSCGHTHGFDLNEIRGEHAHHDDLLLLPGHINEEQEQEYVYIQRSHFLKLERLSLMFRSMIQKVKDYNGMESNFPKLEMFGQAEDGDLVKIRRKELHRMENLGRKFKSVMEDVKINFKSG